MKRQREKRKGREGVEGTVVELGDVSEVFNNVLHSCLRYFGMVSNLCDTIISGSLSRLTILIYSSKFSFFLSLFLYSRLID